MGDWDEEDVDETTAKPVPGNLGKAGSGKSKTPAKAGTSSDKRKPDETSGGAKAGTKKAKIGTKPSDAEQSGKTKVKTEAKTKATPDAKPDSADAEQKWDWEEEEDGGDAKEAKTATSPKGAVAPAADGDGEDADDGDAGYGDCGSDAGG